MRSITKWGRATRVVGLAVLVSLAAGSAPQQADARPAAMPGVQLVPAWGGLKLNRPICFTNNGTDAFLCEQTGRIVRVQDAGGKPSTSTYMDMTSMVDSTGQGGVLCMAFHPQFKNNGRFFVSYLAKGSGGAKFEFRVAEFQGTPTAGNPASQSIILRIPKKRNTHQAGGIDFGPDGHLYIAMGDGMEKRVDKQLEVQKATSQLGKIYAVDVSTPKAPKPAPTNKWASSGGLLAWIYAYGYRNPWRFDWDTKDRMWTVEPGMKGATSQEWISEIVKGGNGRWPHYEGSRRRAEVPGDPTGTPVAPAFTYSAADTGGDNSGVGGKFYKGTAIPALAGKFVFCDYMQGDIYAIDLTSGKGTGWTTIGKCKGPADIGRDAAGELYVCAIDSGIIYKLTAK